MADEDQGHGIVREHDSHQWQDTLGPEVRDSTLQSRNSESNAQEQAIRESHMVSVFSTQEIVIEAILRQFRLPLDSIHGPAHWMRVRRIGLKVALEARADPVVVVLFSMFHDACRISDGNDPDHGRRGAALARELHGTLFQLDVPRLGLLTEACAAHADGGTTSDPTVGACWDADRLDLGRAGFAVDSKYLSTAAARSEGILQWATSLWRSERHAGNPAEDATGP